VLNGLQRLREHARDDDWVWFTTRRAPLITHTDIDALITKLADHPVGGLLAAPVADTMKRANADGAGGGNGGSPWTLARADAADVSVAYVTRGTWRGNQRRRSGDRRGASDRARGLRPQLVEGRGDNIKVTRAEDLRLAEWLLQTTGVSLLCGLVTVTTPIALLKDGA